MRTKSPIIIILGILLLQPLLLGVSTPTTFAQINANEEVNTLSQEPGTRLGPGEFTDHVPILINGTQDFIDQAWPGAGTELDPFLFQGLNITHNQAKMSIEIHNTSAHVLIQDCYINQGSSIFGIYLFNTSHITIEYTTLISAGDGIFTYNANNTVISHSYLKSEASMGLYLTMSEDCTVEGNYFESYSGMPLLAVQCPYFTSVENVYNGTVIAYAMYIVTSNYSTSTNDHVFGMYGVYAVGSFFMEIDGLISEATVFGILATDQDEFSISNGEIGDVTQYGIFVSNCANSSITNCSVSSADISGFLIASCENLVFIGNSLPESGGTGVDITACNLATIENNTVGNNLGFGMSILGCQNSSVRYNEISMTFANGIYLGDSHNATVSHNIVSESNNIGILLDTCANSTVFMNAVEDTYNEGIYCTTGMNQQIFDNTLSVIGASGIYVNNCPDSRVENNDISMCTSSNAGIDVSDSPRTPILLNTLTDCGSGIYLGNSDNSSVLDNILTDIEDDGLDLWITEGLLVSGNTITNTRIGIYTNLLGDPSFESNVLTDCGFFLDGNLPIIYYNYTMSGNTVNGLPIYFAQHKTSGTLSTDNYGQVLLVNCSNFDITGGIMERITVPVELLHCDYIEITDLTSMYNVYGVYLYSSDNVTLSDSYVEGIASSTYSSFGVSADNSDDLIIQNSIFTRCYTNGNHGSLDFDSCVDIDIINCEISYGRAAIYFEDTDNSTILDSEILHFEQYGIRFRNIPCTFIDIERNLIYNSTRGIYGDQASHWMIRNNTVMHNSIYGVLCASGSGDYGNITLNTIESNGYGIYISYSDYYYIYNNTIRWNDYGIYFNQISDGSEVWNNIIALSSNDNGYDDRAGNFWNVSTQGNSWDDFTPPAPYDVDGDTTDEHPTRYLPTMPIIDQPMDFYYAEGSEGNEITWQPFDDALSHWELVIDGSVWDGDTWNFVDITINVDGLDYGTHSGILTVWDVDQNNVTDTIQIIVFDDTPPTISNVPNAEAFVDGSGQTLAWTVSDLHPDMYTVFVDEEEFASGSWTSGELEINIDGLNEGVRNLLMVIRDIDGNSAADPVDILVIADDDAPTLDAPSDITYTEGETGNVITWIAADAYPESFEVTSNGTVFVSGSWGGSRIALNVDGLQPGTHNFDLTVTDGSGNEASDTVRVTVLAIVEETTPPPPVDLGPILIVAGIAGAVVIVIVVIYFLKKKGSA